MEKKILLINPPFNYGLLDSASPRCPPLGLAYIASYLEKFAYKVKILDAFALNLSYREICERIKKFSPDIVGITGVTSNFNEMMKISEMVKTIDKKIKVIVGGPHASIMPKSCFVNGNVDYVVVGEGELTFKELVDAICNGKNTNKVKGICFKKNGKFFRTPDRPLIKDIDSLPMPAYHLLPMESYRPYAVFDVGRKFCSMVTSRGCPYSCTFCCSSALYRHIYRAHSPERVFEEIKLLYEKYGIRHIYFQDDEFTIIHKRVEKICDILIENKLDIIWECLAHPSHITKDLLVKMARAGCVDIVYGVESGCDKILKEINKKITLDQVKKVCRWTKEAGILCRVSFIIGFPYESGKEIRKTIDFAKSLDVDIAYFNVLTPYPNTKIYKIIEDENLFVKNIGWDRYTSYGKKPCVKTRYLNEKEILNWVGRAYLEFYLRPSFLIKRIRSMKNLRHVYRNVATGLSLIKMALGYL